MARSFNGSTQSANGTTPMAFADAQAFSCSAWVQTSSTGTMSIMSTWNFHVSAGINFEMGDFSSPGTINLLIIDANAINFRGSFSTATFNDGGWHNALITYDGSANAANILFYKDGVITATNVNNNTGPGALSNSVFNVGAVDSSSTLVQFFNGSLADLAVWNVKLTATEAAALGKGARPYTIRPTALKFWAPLGGAQSPEPDLSGAVDNLTLVGGPPPDFGPSFLQFTPRSPQFWFPPSAGTQQGSFFHVF